VRRCALVFVAFGAFVACHRRAPSPHDVVHVDAPPTPPHDALATAHLTHPRATVDTVNTALGIRRPVDFLMAASLGVDVAVMAAIDPRKPVDVVFLAREHYAFAMTPPSARQARSLLASRYRFRHTEGLGERLELRGEPSPLGASQRLPCALVAVPGPTHARIVCASDDASLLHTARWIAHRSATYPSEERDLDAQLNADGLRALADGPLRNVTETLLRSLANEANAARRAHDRAPDYGDPEPLVASLRGLADELRTAVASAHSARLHATLTPTHTTCTLTFTVPDVSPFRDAPLTHPLIAMLPHDAVLSFGSHGTSPATLSHLGDLVVRVLGDRIATPAAARADLTALTAHSDGTFALTLSRDVPDGIEMAIGLSQSDHGVGARTALNRIVQSSWLRTVRLGAPLTVTPLREGVRLSRAVSPVSAAIGVRANALVAVYGRRATLTLDATPARALVGALPSALADVRGRTVAALDLRAAGLRVDTPLRLTYDTHRDGELRVATVTLTMPTAALAAAFALADE
jgi:hypothetical protein